MPSVMRTFDVNEYNQIGDYLYYRLNPHDLPKSKINDVPSCLIECKYDWKTTYMQILWERKNNG